MAARQTLGGDTTWPSPKKDAEDKHRKNTKKYWWIRNPQQKTR